MRIVGIGVDTTEISRVTALQERHPESFMNRVFTEGERQYCLSRKKNFGESLAARWAVKEAVMKALGTGWGHGVEWRDIETVSLPSGAPSLVLTGGAKRRSDELGVTEWHISITHSKTEATAFVTASAPD